MTLEIQIGFGLVAIGLILALVHLVRRLSMTRASGHVVRIETIDKDAKTPIKAAKITVRFNDAQGVVRFFSGETRGEERKAGDAIAILYKTSDPQVARIDSLSVWVAPLVLAVLGAFLILKQFFF